MPVAELLDCWFVRVAIGSELSRPEHWVYHVAHVPSAGTGPRAIAGDRLASDDASDGVDTDDAPLLADAFAGVAFAEALRAALPDPVATFTLGGLVSAGLLPAADRQRCSVMLQWLVADGLAVIEDGRIQLATADEVSADDILRTLVFEGQGTAADAALLAGATQTFATCLDRGAPEGSSAANHVR